MSFHSEKIYECEQLIYVCLQIFSEFFIMFYYFFIFPKKTGACEMPLWISAYIHVPHIRNGLSIMGNCSKLAATTKWMVQNVRRNVFTTNPNPCAVASSIRLNLFLAPLPSRSSQGRWAGPYHRHQSQWRRRCGQTDVATRSLSLRLWAVTLESLPSAATILPQRRLTRGGGRNIAQGGPTMVIIH